MSTGFRQRPIEDDLQAIRAMKQPRFVSARTLRAIVNDNSRHIEVVTLAADRTIAHFKIAASRYALNMKGFTGEYRWPADTALAYLATLLSWLPTEGSLDRSRLQTKYEGEVLKAFTDAYSRTIPLEDLMANLPTLQHILKYGLWLTGDEQHPIGTTERKTRDRLMAFWAKFFKSPGTTLGLNARMLLCPDPNSSRRQRQVVTTINETTHPFLDELCAWIADDRSRNSLLYRAGQYGFATTQEIIARRFWDMMLDNAHGSERGDNAEQFLDDPIQYVHADRSAESISAVVVGAFLRINIRMAEIQGIDWRECLGTPSPTHFAHGGLVKFHINKAAQERLAETEADSSTS